MLDIQFIRENPELVQEKSAQKGYKVDVKKLLELDEQRRKLLTAIEALRAERNELTAAAKGSKPSTEQIEKGKALKEKISETEAQLDKVEPEFTTLYKAIPNMPLDTVPVGATEDENVVTKTVGDKPKLDFTPKSDAELGQERDFIDKERAAKVAGRALHVPKRWPGTTSVCHHSVCDGCAHR
jgi:seryl-tRNA synthetase